MVQSSLTRLCKQLKEHQRMGDGSANAHPSVVFELFCQKSEFPWHFLSNQGILALLRNRLRLNDVISSMCQSPGGLTWSVGMMSIFDLPLFLRLDIVHSHDFLNVAWQTVDVRNSIQKAFKIVMKSEIMTNTTYKNA